MIASLIFKLTEGLANKHVSAVKFKSMFTKGVGSLTIHWQALKALERDLKDKTPSELDNRALALNEAACLEIFMKSANLLKAIGESCSMMIDFLTFWSISQDYRKILEQEVKAAKDKKSIEDAEFVVYVCRLKSSRFEPTCHRSTTRKRTRLVVKNVG